MAWIIIAGLIVSGITAIPLESELRVVGNFLQRVGWENSAVAVWVRRVGQGVGETNRNHPFIGYGTDWLAFGHFIIALGFVGALRDPARSRWLFQWGLMACMLVVPYAFAAGAGRGIPLGWTLIDCSFGVLGTIPLGIGWRSVRELETLEVGAQPAPTG